MAALYRFLASYEVWIYLVLALGGLFAFRWVWLAWQEWQHAVFQLEREISMRRVRQAVALSALIVVLFCAEVFLASFVFPSLPAEFFVATPTLNLLATPPGTISPGQATQMATTPLPPAGAASSGCTPQLNITSPQSGSEVKGQVEIIGTVNVPNFGFYKYEVAPRGSETWATIAAGTELKHNEPLGNWNTITLTPGDYQLRLVATDNQGKSLPPCVILVRVVAP